MHELSIATSILELARQHTPSGAILRSVSVQAGAMRGIDTASMELAWRACTKDGGRNVERSKLVLEVSPWRLRCADCGAEFSSQQLDAACDCASTATYPIGGDELLLLGIEVDRRSS